jgi:hypothetical protein
LVVVGDRVLWVLLLVLWVLLLVLLVLLLVLVLVVVVMAWVDLEIASFATERVASTEVRNTSATPSYMMMMMRGGAGCGRVSVMARVRRSSRCMQGKEGWEGCERVCSFHGLRYIQ